MLIKKREEIKSGDITPQDVYLHRRKFLQKAGLFGTVAAVGRSALGSAAATQASATQDGLHFIKSPLSTTGEDLTSFKDVTTYNNFYEFGVGKDDPARHAGSLRTRPWTVSVEGLVSSPKTYDVDSILKMHPSLEERVYRMRCVEGWSMVIPWIGIPLNSVIRAVQPLSKAAYVAFETLYAPTQMPGQQRSVLEWPYVEGLRMDEAMHPLTILAVGLYGAVLPNQNGAPLRLVVPWKYGYKSIKSIVRIKFVEKQPPTSWNRESPMEYGFYSNVNPAVDHPRWSQAKERRIGEFFKRNTLLFNGYADQVAGLYAGMDLKKYH